MKHGRRQAGLTIVLQISIATGLYGVEYPMPSTPQRVSERQLDGRNPVTVVDWGRISESRKRDPQEIIDQREAFKDFLVSPEFMAFVERNGMRTDLLAALAGEEELNKLKQHLSTQPHVTKVQRGLVQTSGEGPLPSFIEGIGAEQRRNLRLVVYNDADSQQREWLLRWHDEHQDDPYFNFAIAIGWTSFNALKRFAQEHPELGISPVPSDDYATAFGVTALPAVVTFPADDRIHRVQGLLPPPTDLQGAPQ